MGAQDHHMEGPAGASGPQPWPEPDVYQSPVESNIPQPPAAPAVVTVSEAPGCCNRAGCRIAYHVVFIVFSIIAVVLIFLAIFVESAGYFVLLGVDAIVMGITWGTYCCVYGCCCGPAKEVVYVPTAVPSASPVVVQMTPQTSNQHYVNQQQPSQPAIGHPVMPQLQYGAYQY